MRSRCMKPTGKPGAKSCETGSVQFSVFASVPGFHHALSTRHGGTSKGQFDSLNLAFHVGDDPQCVCDNRANWARELGFQRNLFVGAQQTHGSTVRVVSQNDIGRGALSWEDALPDCDALVTCEDNVPLLILVADCAPVLLVDPIGPVCAVVHAGWRGALAGIAGKTVRTMQSQWKTKPRDILAAIGPCLSLENLEVGEEVAALVEAKNVNSVVRAAGWPKPHLDLRGLIQSDLVAAGLSQSNIEISPLCPKERNDVFFSHRGQNGRAGRFGVVAWWE